MAAAAAEVLAAVLAAAAAVALLAAAARLLTALKFVHTESTVERGREGRSRVESVAER